MTRVAALDLAVRHDDASLATRIALAEVLAYHARASRDPYLDALIDRLVCNRSRSISKVVH